jgi:hypothetical protein
MILASGFRIPASGFCTLYSVLKRGRRVVIMPALDAGGFHTDFPVKT